VDFGSGSGHLAKAMMQAYPPPLSEDNPYPREERAVLSDIPSERMERLVMIDSAEKLLHRDPEFLPPFLEKRTIPTLESLPLDENSVDCVISNLALHWINDLPGMMGQINRVLVPDGLFLAAILGGDTLFELRGSIQLAEQERKGGVAPHISPMAGIPLPQYLSNLQPLHILIQHISQPLPFISPPSPTSINSTI
jgi:NADH dehydrogenase [ubiquinone] 1 alpha subcomplex assembly factor 5